ncbi:hypothetical protein ACHMW5_02300 [Azospirillum melinis]|uniref:hypothetical protein n=1 Tax=Azospirillum melinis TaxID=328839 RepID=UPI00375733C0
MLKIALAAAPDIALSGGYLSTPLWLDTVHDLAQTGLIVIGIVVGVLRIEAMLRARRSSSTSNSGDQS